MKKDRTFNKKLSLWFYRKMQFTINHEALERRLRIRYINPRKTSSMCPRCRNKLESNSNRVLKCSKCSFIGEM